MVSGAVLESTLEALQWLCHSRMLCLEGNKWAPRPLGLATHASGLLPEEALFVKEARHMLFHCKSHDPRSPYVCLERPTL